MSNIIELTVESSTKTVNDNFANKLVGKTEGVQTAFGEVEGGKRTFYMFTDTENAKGTKGPVDLDQFDTVKNEFPFTDDKGLEQVATLSYLYPKRTV
tara:strand:+ start:2302 stop:2592 length:291 start_codon:yes stop_codon:yes gene_type:complete